MKPLPAHSPAIKTVGFSACTVRLPRKENFSRADSHTSV